MNMKRLVKPFLYATVVMLMSVSCERKDPCDDGSCCGPSPQKLVFIRSLDNVKADVQQPAGLLIENFGYAGFCVLQSNLPYIQDLESTYIDGQPRLFKYRVWGTVFECVSCPVIAVGMHVYYVQIHKIEKVN